MGISFKVSKKGTRFHRKPQPSKTTIVEDDDVEISKESGPINESTRKRVAYVTEANEDVTEFSDSDVSFILNLFPEGYSIAKASENELRNQTSLQEVPKFFHPYDRTSETLFSAIESGRLPGDALDDIPFKYIDGSLVCEVRDYRNCTSEPGVNGPSAYGSPVANKVRLRMSLENVVKDIPLISDDAWTYGDLMEVESRILKALQPQLCLNPIPKLDRLCDNPVSSKLNLALSCMRRKRLRQMPEVTATSNNMIHGKVCMDGVPESSNCRLGESGSIMLQPVNENLTIQNGGPSNMLPLRPKSLLPDASIPTSPLVSHQSKYQIGVGNTRTLQDHGSGPILNVPGGSPVGQDMISSYTENMNTAVSSVHGKRENQDGQLSPISGLNKRARLTQMGLDGIQQQHIGPHMDGFHTSDSHWKNTLLQQQTIGRGLQYANPGMQKYPQQMFEGEAGMLPFTVGQQGIRYGLKEEPVEIERLDKPDLGRSKIEMHMMEGEMNHMDSQQSRLQQRLPVPQMRSSFPQTPWNNLGQPLENISRKEDQFQKRKLVQSPRVSAGGLPQSPLSSKSGEFSSGSVGPHFGAVAATAALGSSQKEKAVTSVHAVGGTTSLTSSANDSMQRQHQAQNAVKRRSNSLPKTPAMSGVGSPASVSNMGVPLNASSPPVGTPPLGDQIMLDRFSKIEIVTARYGNERHRVVEDKLMRQKARLLLDEAASWSLLWYLYGKGEELPEDLVTFPTTSHLEACQFVVEDHTAQHCLRIVQWLEGLASKALDLDNEVRGSHVGTHLPSSGIWHHTQRYLKKGATNPKIVHHLDFDAPTREHTQQLPDDKKQDESLLEDVWTLLRAGRLEEACNLCRSAGQPWRAAVLCAFGGLDHFPSVEALMKNGKNRSLQAVELESGVGHQWRLWKWASFIASERIAEEEGGKYETAIYASQCSNLKRILPICRDWESACWAMAKSWFHFQVDMELARSQPGGMDQFKSYEDVIEKSPGEGIGVSQPIVGPENWPLQVQNQQPRNLSALLQKLHSSDAVHEAVIRGCKEQQRQIEMNLMLGDIPRLLDLIWSWISPSEDDLNVFRPHGDPQMIRFGAHLVLVLRYLLVEEMRDAFKEKIMTLGDLILHMYTMFLFSKQQEELVGIYASQLARHRCIDLFVHMMELRLNGSVHVRYKIFLSAIENLPFTEDESKGSFEEIIERVLTRSREIKVGKYDKSSDVAEQNRLQSQQKARVIQWLCFTPPSTINDANTVNAKLLRRALMHSNVLFREFALISMWRVPAMPLGAHTLLSLLAEPLNQLTETLFSAEDHDVSENLEFNDWSEYYSCDATYRNWLKIDLDNAEVSSPELSNDEKQRAVAAARETLDSSLLLLQRKENPWLVFVEDCIYESTEPVFLELHATAMLCLPSGECLSPDATLCTTLMSALYTSVSEEVVLNRQLMVNVSISATDSYCIEIVLRCLATEGDGLGLHELNDGGVLATVIASGFKGELVRFQAGVTIEISRLDAWYSSSDGSLEDPATYIVRGLCRRCCIPEIILRCMQVSVSLVESGNPPEGHDELIELVACPESGFLHLFSQHQLQEFLLYEREYWICKQKWIGGA